LNVDDCYHELGLAPGSSDAEVKAAWRRLAARWHPDRNASPQALRKIQQINRALDEIRRAREEAAAEAAAGTEAGEANQPDEAPDSSMDTLQEHTVAVTLDEVVAGCSREVRGEVVDDCAECAGSGLQAHASSCSECGGAGQVRQPFWFGWGASLVECSACRGHGSTRQGCPACDATGKAPPRKYRGHVDIPAGVRDGDLLDGTARVQGRDARQPQRVRVRVRLEPHALFEAEADGTVRLELPVDGFAWMANRWIDVPTPHGLRQMKLLRGAANYRIKGAGLPWQPAGAAADCIVTVVPTFPAEFSRAQEAAIDRLVASNSGAPGTAAHERLAAWQRRVDRWQGQAAPRERKRR
jgi:DnaJ-class molecular chaperone